MHTYIHTNLLRLLFFRAGETSVLLPRRREHMVGVNMVLAEFVIQTWTNPVESV